MAWKRTYSKPVMRLVSRKSLPELSRSDRMARPDPNIFSQKCGNGCTGALASTVISCAAAGESSRGADSREVARSRMVARAKQRHNFFIRLLYPHEHSKSACEKLPTRELPAVWGTRWQVTALYKRRRPGKAPPDRVRS